MEKSIVVINFGTSMQVERVDVLGISGEVGGERTEKNFCFVGCDIQKQLISDSQIEHFKHRQSIKLIKEEDSANNLKSMMGSRKVAFKLSQGGIPEC